VADQQLEKTVIRTHKALIVASVLVAAVMVTMYVRAAAQVVNPRPEELRFHALQMQPVATPDRRSVVPGITALVVRDRVTGQCFIAITLGDSVGLSSASCGQ
jgi:hypothetical protein